MDQGREVPARSSTSDRSVSRPPKDGCIPSTWRRSAPAFPTGKRSRSRIASRSSRPPSPSRRAESSDYPADWGSATKTVVKDFELPYVVQPGGSEGALGRGVQRLGCQAVAPGADVLVAALGHVGPRDRLGGVPRRRERSGVSDESGLQGCMGRGQGEVATGDEADRQHPAHQQGGTRA